MQYETFPQGNHKQIRVSSGIKLILVHRYTVTKNSRYYLKTVRNTGILEKQPGMLVYRENKIFFYSSYDRINGINKSCTVGILSVEPGASAIEVLSPLLNLF